MLSLISIELVIHRKRPLTSICAISRIANGLEERPGTEVKAVQVRAPHVLYDSGIV
jgi:hypothetical protein